MKKFKITMLLLVVIAALSGCGRETSASVSKETLASETSAPEISAPVTPAPEATAGESEPEPEVEAPETLAPETPASETPAPVTPAPVAAAGEDIFYGIELTDSMTKIGHDSYDGEDQINVYSVSMDGTMPYYVGRDNAEAVNFMKNNKTSEDGFLYLGLPMYLPDKVKEGTVYVTVSDETVARIENNELIGLKQGVFILSSYDSEKNLMEEKKFVCTTFNDSKDNKESLMTLGTGNGSYTYAFLNARDIEYWKNSVHTIMDMSYMLQARHFVYDFNKEPESGILQDFEEAEKRWTWTQSAETIFEMSGGVCIQVAQLAIYMLADDYEDWGVIYVEGMQGHVFNWFYEDGLYYIFDFTQVISDNAWSKGDSYFEYWDYSDEVKIFRTVDEITKWCVTEKVNKDENYLIYMISCLGHDYLPCSMNSGMSSSVDCLNGTFNGGTITMGFQDVVFEKLEVLYHKEGSVDINFITLTAEEISNSIPYGIYGDTEKLEYRFEY